MAKRLRHVNLDEVDPRGRLDVLFSRVVQRKVHETENPFLIGLYNRYKQLIDAVFNEHLGPIELPKLKHARAKIPRKPPKRSRVLDAEFVDPAPKRGGR